MTGDWKLAVSANASTVIIRDIAGYVEQGQGGFSPIDVFYIGRNELLRAITTTYASGHPAILPLVLVGLISQTENYFREIMSGVISLCPIAKEKCADKSLNLATAWFGYGRLEKGAFENTSFSDKKNVKNNFKNLIGFEIASSSQINTPLEEFGRLCELRHAIVHSAGLLAGKNAIKLQLPGAELPGKVSVGFRELHEAAAVCTALVCSVNIELFAYISKRWLHEWPKTPAYAGADFHQLFKSIWTLFYSEQDEANGLISSPLTLMKAKNLIVKNNGV